MKRCVYIGFYEIGARPDIRILKNGEVIRRFHPIISIRILDNKVEYVFDPEVAPAIYAHAGKITIEMYAPAEVKKGEKVPIIIVAQVPRHHESYGRGDASIHGVGSIKLCYSEKIDLVDSDYRNFILIRGYNDDFDSQTMFEPQDECNLGNEYFKALREEVIGLYPGTGFCADMINAWENCGPDLGYNEDYGYDCGPPSSADWKNNNEYDRYMLVYDTTYDDLFGTKNKKFDTVWAYFYLGFNEPGEYTIHGFFELSYPAEYNYKKIGKELVWTVKGVE